MAKEHIKDLLKFLKPFPEQKETVLRLRLFVWGQYPQVNELIRYVLVTDEKSLPKSYIRKLKHTQRSNHCEINQ